MFLSNFTKKSKIILASVFGGAAIVGGALYYALTGNGDSYCNVIPKETVMIARVSPYELLEKNDLTYDDLFKRFDIPAKIEKKIKRVMEESIDAEKPIYFFVDKKVNFGIVFKVRDAEELKKVLEKEGDADVDEKDGYYWITEKKGPVFCFNNEKALFLINPVKSVKKSTVLALMEQSKDESAMGTQLYEQLVDCKKSMALNINASEFLELISEQAASELNSEQTVALSVAAAAMPDCNLLYTFDIEGEKIQGTMDILPVDEKAEKQLEKYTKLLPTIKGSLIDKGMKDPMAWACMGFSGNDLLKQLDKVSILEEPLREARSEIDIDGIASSFEGDVSLAVTISDGETPAFLVLAETANNKYQGFCDMMAETDLDDYKVMSLGNGNYSILQRDWSSYFSSQDYYSDYNDYDDDYGYIDEYVDDDYGYDYSTPSVRYDYDNPIAFFGNNNNMFYATSDKHMRNISGDTNNSLKDYSNDIKGCLFYGIIDMKQLYKYVNDNAHNREDKQIAAVLKNFESITLRVEPKHADFTVNMKSGTKFFDCMFDLIDEIK